VKRHGLLKQAIVAPIAISLAAVVAVADRPDMARATASTYQQPFAWGSVQTGKTAYAAFGSPVTGTTTLSDTAPSGAGSLATRVTASGPTSKMSYLRAFGGATPLFFSRSGSTSHILAAVATSSGSHELWTWGTNTYGQLGNGSVTATPLPKKATWTPLAGEEIIALTAGERHSMMLTLQGATRRVYTWGNNAYGQLGTTAVASTASQLTPLLLSSLTSANIVSIAAGRYHNVAADSTGAIWAWGYDTDAYGDIGLAGSSSRFTPTKITDDSLNVRRAVPTTQSITSNIATISTNAYHYFAIGDSVVVNIGDDLLDGTKTITKVTNTSFSYVAQPAVTSTPISPTGLATLAGVQVAVTNKSLTSNVATLTVPTGHGLAVGNTITIDGVGAPFDGVSTITVSSSTSIRFAKTYAGTITSTAVSPAGSATRADISVALSNKLVSLASNVATARLTSSNPHGFGVGNVVAVTGAGGVLDGQKTITAVSTTSTFDFIPQTNYTARAVTSSSPTASVTTCSTACPSAPTGVLSVAAGIGYSVAQTADSVYTWGNTTATTYNRLGRAISGTYISSPKVVALGAGCVPSAIAAGRYTAAVVCANNTIRTWGDNTYGQRGSGTAAGTHTTLLESVSGISLNASENISKVDFSTDTAFALTSTGRIFSWGRNWYRLLGISSLYAALNLRTTAAVTTRAIATGGATVTDLVADSSNALFIDSADVVWSWGNPTTSLGARGVSGTCIAAGICGTDDGMKFDRIDTASDVRIAMADATDNSSVFVMSDGSVWTSGSIGSTAGTYFLGDGTTGSRILPGKIDLPFGVDTATPSSQINQLSCSRLHCLIAVAFSGASTIYGWGDGSSRQLIVGSTTDYAYPIAIKNNLANPRIAAGYQFSLYVDIGANGAGGTAYGWGANSSRRAVPTATATTSLTTLTEVKDMTIPASPATVSDIIAISAGYLHTVALRANGTLMTWGYNNFGQLGAGTTNTATYFATPSLPTGKVAAQIVAQGDSTLIRCSDGTLVGWGSAARGVLASGSTASLLTPTSVASGYSFNYIDIAGLGGTATASSYRNSGVGILTSGAVVTWGANTYGQIGRSDWAASATAVTAYSTSPVQALTSNTTAINDVDAVVAGGIWSAAFGFYTAPTPPSAPTSVSASSNASKAITVTWGLPTSPNDLVSYNVVIRRAGVVVARVGAPADATSLTLTGPTYDIINASTHSVTVEALNTVGTSPESSSVSVTPIGAPSVPRSVQAEPTSSGIRLTFAAPSDNGGASISLYNVVVVDSGTTTQRASATLASSDTSALITSGLVVGSSYDVSISATNTAGTSDTVTVTAVVPGRPSAPLISEAHAEGTGDIVVTWTAPESDGGAPITSYVARAYSRGTDSVVATSFSSSSSTRSLTLAGLTDGTLYDIGVVASQDNSSQSNAIAAAGSESIRTTVMAGRLPAPTSLTISDLSSGSVTLQWPSVSNATGISITEYSVKYVLGATTSTTTASTSLCTAGVCAKTLTGLTNGSQYTVSVASTSSNGTGTYSTTISATPRTVPGAPENIAVESGNASLTISFSAPTSNGGNAITSYTATATLSGVTIATQSVGATETTAALVGLVNGTTYNIQVSATNDEGSSAAATETGTPATVPGVPTIAAIRPGSIYIEWLAPDTGGSPITYYAITVVDPMGITSEYTTGAGAVTGTSSCLTSARTCTITSVSDSIDSTLPTTTLVDDTRYSVSVAAANAQGVGDTTSAFVVTAGQPNEPTALTASAGNRYFDACWSAPTYTPLSAAVTSYSLQADHSETTSTLTINPDDLVDNVAACASPLVGVRVAAFDDGSMLSPGETYAVTVSASTSPSDYVYGMSSTSTSVTPFAAPSAPTVTAVLTSETTAQVTWSASLANGSAVTLYTVTASPGSHSCTWTSGPLSCTITGLSDSTSYSFTVVATNTAGNGPASTVFAQSTESTTTSTSSTSSTSSTTSTTSTMPNASTQTTVAATTPPSLTVPTATTIASAAKTPKWISTPTKLAYGKSLLVAQSTGASASFSTSTKKVTLFYSVGPNYGKLSLFLNDKQAKIIDQYSSKAARRSVTITKSFLIKKITLVALGQKSKKSKSSAVNIDALSFTSATCVKKCATNPVPLGSFSAFAVALRQWWTTQHEQ
jgi:alpha-tubulin suppressor-like RCC1 family protein